MRDLWRRSSIGVCAGVVSAIDLCPRSYIGVCRGGVCVSDLCRRSYIGVYRGGVCVSDLWRRMPVSHQSVEKECPTRVSRKSVSQESYKSVK